MLFSRCQGVVVAETAADQLERLGLSSYEARAYATLAETPGMTAEMVSERADIPKGRVYDVLNSLCERSLVRSDKDRPKRYVAVEPDVAVDRLLTAQRRELDRRRARKESAAEEARDLLSRIDPEDPDRSFWTSAAHEEEAKDLLLERFATAEGELSICLNTIDAPRDTSLEYFDAIGQLLDAGVAVRLLLGADLEIPEAIRDEYRRLVDAGMTVRRTPDIPDRRFTVIDASEACIEVRHPVDRTEMLAVIDFRNSEIARELHRSFQALWRDAAETTE